MEIDIRSLGTAFVIVYTVAMAIGVAVVVSLLITYRPSTWRKIQHTHCRVCGKNPAEPGYEGCCVDCSH